MSALPLALLLSIAGCDGLENNTDTAISSDGCPAGTHRAAGEVLVRRLQIDGLDYVANWDPTVTYQGSPAACASDAGDHTVILLTMLGEAIARLEVQGGAEGIADLNGAAPTLQVDLFLEDGVSGFSSGDWQAGAWAFSAAGPALQSYELDGNAARGGHLLSLNVAVSVTP
ncbi:MAG: hypothetical protein JXX28_00070 [Deltaproteobacteria bacterium]|nr:hypothetical protein [Deltaproteobacteria bacterium]